MQQAAKDWREGCQIGYGSCILSHSTHNSIRLMGYHFMEYNAKDLVSGYIAKQTTIYRYTFVGGGLYYARRYCR